MADSTAPPNPPPLQAPPPGMRKKRHWLLIGCGGLLLLLLVVVATVAITFWWLRRPIKPVVLSAKEKAVAEEKVRVLSGGAPAPASPASPQTQRAAPGRPERLVPAPAPASPDLAENPAAERRYVPGSKVLMLTEREVNGLLNANTDLGKSLRLEFDRDAINAYLAVRIPDDFPIGAGKMFRARGRFRMSIGNGGAPYLILEDVTVFGLSLPKAWLGGLKGENLLGEALGQRGNLIHGIKNLRVEPGALVLELAD